MMSRPARWRFAFLALLATMLLIAMPTLTQVRAAVASDGAPRMHAMHAAMAGMRHDTLPAGQGRQPAHDGACAYCPLLAGLLHWDATPQLLLHSDAVRFTSAIAEHPARARTRRGTLGSRGPPAPRAA